MTRIKMGSDESHFNVSLIVRDKVTRQCQQTTTFEVKGEPKQRLTYNDLTHKPKLKRIYKYAIQTLHLTPSLWLSRLCHSHGALKLGPSRIL